MITWIRSYHAADKSYPTYEAIMEHSRRIDPSGVGIDLPTAMACYRTVRDGKADQLEQDVIDWIRGFYAANATLPTYQAIMERSTVIDPDGVGIDLSTAMAYYETAKDGLDDTSREEARK